MKRKPAEVTWLRRTRSQEKRTTMDSLDKVEKFSWALLPKSFKRVRLLLARDQGHPEPSASVGYVLVAPLTEDGWIDTGLWRQYHEFCSVIRFRPGMPNDVGHIFRNRDGSWAFRYDVTGNSAGEIANYLCSERFLTGRKASILDDSGLHMFEVASIEPI
jgi:hypothetical protein